MGRSGAIDTSRETPERANPEIAAEEPTRRFLERVSAYRQEIERRRFAGDDPVVRPKRRGALEAAAAVLAAERLRGLLDLGAGPIGPAEDLAAEELYGALRALTGWDFSLARRRLELASQYARLPSLQQQVSLGRVLHHLCRAVFFTEPGERWDGAERAVLDLIPTLDRIPADEAAFYRHEAARLAGVWMGAAEDNARWTGWALARARGAAREGGREAELAWLLRAYRRNAGKLKADQYLEASIGRAEALFRLLLPDLSDDERQRHEAAAADARERDLFPMLVAALNHALDADVMQLSNGFALMIYRAPVAGNGAAS